MKKIIPFIFTSFIAFSSIQCGNETNENENSEAGEVNGKASSQDKQLNITLLLDLSDRIDPAKNPNTPEHYQRDIAIINEFVSAFKNDMEKKGAYKAKGKMKVIFSPQPQDANINKIASELNIDLSNVEVKEKKNVFENLSGTFVTNLETIYQTTIQHKNYIGSDVWRFFKNDVKDYAVYNDENYRNILVILTDGYLYHTDSKDKQGNRSTYVTPESINANKLYGNDWKNTFEKGDFGYITTRKDLENLEVLVLEVNPIKTRLSDEDIMKTYLEKWFKEMNVKKFEIYNTDLPSNTKLRIDKFLKGM
ncbi:hypothetical protein [Bergeyella zoohelcum]|uniref:VWFA domain-containing protein n=1 Tax=Bergeyella zoohelcum TaxID=1015 RepID=A0A7Z8YPL4_9FLAO|nr:hypothetical protein [Bergeyella zoohelcum]VDH05169.1 Uncharacterised protein [Bergeyella zoohelcum]